MHLQRLDLRPWGHERDGLIVISDSATGLWLFKMAGFQGWNGEDWGMPNISSVQDWDKGPVRGGRVLP